MHASDGDAAHADGRGMKKQDKDKNHEDDEDEYDDEHADDEEEEENMDDEDDVDDEDDDAASCACSICSRALSRPASCSNASTLPIILVHEVCSGD